MIEESKLKLNCKNDALRNTLSCGPSSPHSSGCCQYSFTCRLRKSDRNEVALGVKIVFPRFINNAHQSALCRHCIRQGDVNLSFFERRSIVPVLDANHELFCCHTGMVAKQSKPVKKSAGCRTSPPTPARYGTCAATGRPRPTRPGARSWRWYGTRARGAAW